MTPEEHIRTHYYPLERKPTLAWFCVDLLAFMGCCAIVVAVGYVLWLAVRMVGGA